MTTCDRFAKILKGEKETDAPKGVCFVTRMRDDLPAKILGRRTRSKVVFYMSFSFENVDSNGRALCFGEFVFRQREVKPFIDTLARHGITETSLHNHWLKESPRLMYIHWEAIMPPLRFARISQNALNAAGVKPPTSS